jgi:hypothetical protein
MPEPKLPKYDARLRTQFTLQEAESLVGAKARLPLTGMFVEARESENGPYLMFEVDPRWGLAPGTRLGFDVEAFDKIRPSRRVKKQ